MFVSEVAMSETPLASHHQSRNAQLRLSFPLENTSRIIKNTAYSPMEQIYLYFQIHNSVT